MIIHAILFKYKLDTITLYNFDKIYISLYIKVKIHMPYQLN